MAYTAMQLAEAYLETGELNLALAALDEHLMAFPQDDGARRLRVQVLRDFPDGIALALADLDAIAAPNAHDFGVRGGILKRQADLHGAAAAYEQAWMLSPISYAEAYFRVLKQIGELDQALRVLESLPKGWQWYQTRAEIHVLRGDYAAALEQFDAAAEQLKVLIDGAQDKRLLIPLLAALVLKRADAHRRFGHYREAETCYRIAEVYEPNDAALPFNRGLMRFERGNLRGAITLCRRGWDHANDAMRASMRAELSADPRYQPILEAISTWL